MLSVNATAPAPVICRDIAASDFDAVVACLKRNFPRRSAAFWRRTLALVGSLPAAPGRPRYGHCLEAGGAIVGVLLEVSHASDLEGAPPPRCSLSSWAVDPRFRSLALVLQRRATRDRAYVYLNLSAAPHTFKTNEAMGLRRYAEGAFFAAPWLSRGAPGARLAPFALRAPEAAGLSAWERAMLADHARFGLSAAIGVIENRATPFVWRLRPLWRHVIPTARLIYARSEADLVAFAPARGARRRAQGRLRRLVAANGPNAGLVGRYVADRAPFFALRGSPPATTDLAYSELAWL